MRQELLRYYDILSGCRLFEGMDAETLSEALECMRARVLRYAKGETICRPGDPVREAGIVLEGMVAMESYDIEGEKTNLNMLQNGYEFGLVTVLNGGKCPMHIFAQSECALLMLDIRQLQHFDFSDAVNRRIYQNLLSCLSERCANLYRRLRIYGKKRIRSRIRLYLMSLDNRDGVVNLPMNRTALADYLGVDRTALARELGRMQDEGLIAVDKRRIRLVNQDFFQPGGKG